VDAVRAVERLTRSIEDFNSVFIRLPALMSAVARLERGGLVERRSGK
jgi:hypothetical protein